MHTLILHWLHVLVVKHRQCKAISYYQTSVIRTLVFSELPRLNLPPVLSPDGVEPTELTIEWSRWDFKNGDTGDPPILWYNVWIQDHTQTKFVRIGMVFDMFCGENCNYTITELRPNTEYKVYITSSRDGEGGDGPPGQLLYARTDCGGTWSRSC